MVTRKLIGITTSLFPIEDGSTMVSTTRYTSAEGSGGAIAAPKGDVTIGGDATLTGNFASSNGGAIYAATATFGGSATFEGNVAGVQNEDDEENEDEDIVEVEVVTTLSRQSGISD